MTTVIGRHGSVITARSVANPATHVPPSNAGLSGRTSYSEPGVESFRYDYRTEMDAFLSSSLSDAPLLGNALAAWASVCASGGCLDNQSNEYTWA